MPRILVVEDEALIAAELADRLTHMGFGPIGPVDTAAAAIAIAHGERPDLVLMDVRLKGESDGIEAARTIQSVLDIPVVFLTANVDRVTYERSLGTEHFGFVVKPFTERDLRLVIDTALGRAASARRLARALAQEHHVNAMIFEGAPTAMAVVDASGQIRRANRRMRDLRGLTDGAQHLRRLGDVLGDPAATELARGLHHVADGTREQMVGEYVVHRADGSRCDVLATVVRLPSSAGAVADVLLSVFRIDGRRRLMLEGLKHAEPEAQKGRLPARVLLVEDEPAIRTVLTRILQREGVRVTDAADGLAALAILDREGSAIDVVLTDVVMPHMDGAALAQRIRADYPAIPVLFMSGYVDEARMDGLAQYGASPVLRKPFRQSELLDVLAGVVA